MNLQRSFRPGRRRLLVSLIAALAAFTVAFAPATPAQALPPCCDNPPPQPAPPCNFDGGYPKRADEHPLVASSFLFAEEIAKAIPHIEWCANVTGKIQIRKFAETTVVPISAIFVNWEFVGGPQTPYIDGNGNGRFTQSIKISAGAGIEIGGSKYGAIGSCVMTIDRTYSYLRTTGVFNFLPHDNLGDCKPIWHALIAEAAITPIPEPAVLPYPPVEIAWVEPGPNPFTDVVIHTTMEVVEFSWETDIIDSPLGGGGGGGDPGWGDYFEYEA